MEIGHVSFVGGAKDRNEEHMSTTRSLHAVWFLLFFIRTSAPMFTSMVAGSMFPPLDA